MKVPAHVLVMAVGSPLGQSIYKALRASTLRPVLFRADISDMAAGFYLDDEATNVLLPPVRDRSYRTALTDAVRRYEIDVIFPVISVEHEHFAAHAATYASLGVHVVTPHPSTYEVCNDKYRSMCALRECGLKVPDTSLCAPVSDVREFLSRNQFPLILKPRFGASSARVFVVRSRPQLDSIVAAFPDEEFVVQELLADPAEYTVGVYVSRDGSFKKTITIRRELRFGLSYRGEVVTDERISEYSLRAALALGLSFSSNVQLRYQDGQPCAFEINPRLSSTTVVRAHFGFNEPEMVLRDLSGQLAEFDCSPRAGRFSRYWEETYLEDR